MLIGLFVAIACALIVGMVLFLEPSVGDGKQTLVMRFSNINGISLGTRVMFAGKPVGEVEKIEQIPHARDQPTDELGQVYFYQLILKIDSSVRAYNTDEFTIQTSGLLGEKSISIVPRSPPKGVIPKRVTAKTPIYAAANDPLESVFSELSGVADKMDEALDKVITWIDQNGNELGSAVRSFDDAMSEASSMLESINKLKVIDDVKIAVQNFGTTMGDISSGLEQLQDDHFFANLGDTMHSIKGASSSVDDVMRNIVQGKGTLGKIISDDDTYLQVTSILSKVDTLMNDVNHYGLFFNLNKEWQKTRVRQISQLNALKTPQNFRSYFEKEVDGINTAMARISMLINKAERRPDFTRIVESKPFRKDFAELLRLTQEMLDNLTLYNQQLMEAVE